jgi:hypothetical protein
MEYRKNPRIRRTKCFRCLLSPSREESAIFVGINKVIASAIDQENNNTSSSTIYPCPILNRYECPFDKKKSNNNDNNKIKQERKKLNSNLLDVDDLFNLSEIAFQVQLALGKAQTMTKSNETIYETDFEAGKVKEIYANYYGDPYSFSTEYPLEEKLSEVKRLSKVPIRNVQDVYNALTDRETLNKVLKQGLDDVEYQRHRDELVTLFIGLKDKIKIEDLTIYEPIFTLNIQKSKCSICQKFANIHCINCSNNFWLCVDHWMQHKEEDHS